MTSIHYQQLVTQFFDESISDAESQELIAALEKKPSLARRFQSSLRFDDVLRRNLQAQRSDQVFLNGLQFRLEQEAGVESALFPAVGDVARAAPENVTSLKWAKKEREGFGWRWLGGWAAAAAAFVFGVFYWPQATKPVVQGVASVGEVKEGAAFLWQGEEKLPITKGMNLASGKVEVVEGSMRIDMKNGTVIAAEAPSVFEVLDDERLVLEEGVLAATKGQKARALSVRSGDMLLKDLGTSFGVEKRGSGMPASAVFSGEVEAGTKAGKLSIGALESVALGPEGVEEVPFDAEAYAEIWPLICGVQSFSGRTSVVLPGVAQDSPEMRDAARVMVSVEAMGMQLEQILSVDVSGTGHFRGAESRGKDLSPGTKVHVYLLQAWSQNDQAGGFKVETITFDQEILGVVTEDGTLKQWDEVLKMSEETAGVLNGLPHRGLEWELDDSIEIRETDRTLLWHTRTDRAAEVDQIRVVVRAE